MSTDQYTPTDDDMRWQYVVKRMHDGATRTHAEQEYTRWLAAHDARVHRDAAREAEARIKAVQDVHKPTTFRSLFGSGADITMCTACSQQFWPCPTIHALEA